MALIPGTYSVATPSTVDTPDSEVDIDVAYITGADPQTVTLAPGGSGAVTFSSAYGPTITVDLAGPEEPSEPGIDGSSSATGTVFDNDAVDGTTVTVTPTGGTQGSAAYVPGRGRLPGRQCRLRRPGVL